MVQLGLIPVASGRVQQDVANDDVEDVCFQCGVGDLILEDDLANTHGIQSHFFDITSRHEQVSHRLCQFVFLLCLLLCFALCLALSPAEKGCSDDLSSFPIRCRRMPPSLEGIKRE